MAQSLPEALIDALRTVRAILQQHRGETRRGLLRSYLLLQLRRASRRGRPGGEPRTAGLLGNEVAYFSEEALAILIREVFVEKAYYLHLSNDRPFIVDGGANIGLSILLFKRLWPGCEILAFEPDPETFSLLERNVSVNRLEGVQLVNAALHDAVGSIAFHYDPETPGNLGMSIRATEGLRGRREVETVLLSSYVDREVDLLKLDIEGAEHEVIRDLAKTGKLKRIGQIIMEYHHHVEPSEDHFGEMLRLLEVEGFGYQVYANAPMPLRPERFSALFLYAYRKDVET